MKAMFVTFLTTLILYGSGYMSGLKYDPKMFEYLDYLKVLDWVFYFTGMAIVYYLCTKAFKKSRSA